MSRMIAASLGTVRLVFESLGASVFTHSPSATAYCLRIYRANRGRARGRDHPPYGDKPGAYFSRSRRMARPTLNSLWSLSHPVASTRQDRHHECMPTVFEAAGGNDGLRRLADAWHRRVMADEVVAHAFSHGFHPQHVERLAAYWAEALGGPTTYSDSYGDETTVVKMHSGNGEHEEMDRRAIACFDQALADVGLANNDALRQVLHDYFAWATTTTMSRYHRSADDVPNGLSIPHWSWNGLQV